MALNKKLTELVTHFENLVETLFANLNKVDKMRSEVKNNI